jgi:hypothetical protein
MRIVLAIRAFFVALFNADRAERIRQALDGAGGAEPSATGVSSNPVGTIDTNRKRVDASPSVPSAQEPTRTNVVRSDALTLLSVLQRESRLLDLVTESLDAYSDEQIGSAARTVLRDAHQSLSHVFGLQPIASESEGETIGIPENPSPIRWRISGNSSSPRGTLAHPGWVATRVELPKWTGNKEDALVISPVEVETRS